MIYSSYSFFFSYLISVLHHGFSALHDKQFYIDETVSCRFDYFITLPINWFNVIG